MNLMDLYERQQQEIERFKSLRDKVWTQVLCDNEKLTEAFGGQDNLNDDARKLYQSRINSFNAEWSMDNGIRYKDMLSQHEKQILQITGQKEVDSFYNKESVPRKEKTEYSTKDKFRNQREQITDKNQEANNKNEEAERKRLKENIVKQQAIIKARKIQKKRSR